ncbi:hypothetical protein ACWG8W_06200 [Citricoccus zhacaiensis]
MSNETNSHKPSRAERIQHLIQSLAGSVPREKVPGLSPADFKEHIETRWDRISSDTNVLNTHREDHPHYPALAESREAAIREALADMDAYEAAHGTAWMSA